MAHGRIALLLLCLLAALVPGLAGAQSEPLWARVVRPLLVRQLPGLSIEGLSGTLTRDPRAARITLADEHGAWLVLEDAGLVIDAAALFRGNIRLEAITAARAALLRRPGSGATVQEVEDAPPEAQGALPTLPQLAFGVQVDRIAIARFELGEGVLGRAAVLTLDGRIALDSGRLEARFAAQRQDAPGALRLDLALDPAANRLRAEVALDEPPGGLIGTAAGLAEHPASLMLRLDGPATGAQIEARGAIGPDVSLSLAGTLRAGADGSYGAVLDGSVAAAPLLPPEIRGIATPFGLRLDAALSPARLLRLAEARFTVPGGALRLAGSADLAAGTLDMGFGADVPDSGRFAGFVPDSVGWRALRAEGRVRGPAATARVTAAIAAEGFASPDARLAALVGAAPRVELDATLAGQVDGLRLRGAAIGLEIAGRVAAPLDATARLALSDLSVFGAGFGGSLTGALRAEGAPADPTLTLAVSGTDVRLAGHALTAPVVEARIASPFSAPRAEARLAAQYGALPVSIDLAGEPEGQRLRLRRMTAGFGPARLEASGLVDLAAALFDGSLALEAAQVAPFGDLAGVPIVGGLRLAGRFDASGGRQRFDVQADLAALGSGANTVTGRATVQGLPDDGRLRFEGAGAGANILTEASWRGTAEGWRIGIARMEARYAGEAFRLAAPARLLAPPEGGVVVEALTLAPRRGGSLGLTGRWAPDRVDLTAVASALPLRLLTTLARSGQPVEGSIGGRIRATGTPEAPDWQAALRARGVRPVAAAAARLPAAEITLDASGTGALRAELRAAILAGAGIRLDATARLPQGFAATAPVAARAEGQVDLGLLTAPFLASGADRVTGRARLALQAEGSLGDPRLGGEVVVAGASYRNAAQGIAVTDLGGTLAAEGNRLEIRRLQGRTPGGGSIAAQGSMQVTPAGLVADITVQARGARPVQSDLFSATMDADLTVTGTLPSAARLAGTVDIARAEIRIPERLPPSVRTIPGVRERGGPPTRRARPAAAAETSALPPVALALRVGAQRAVFLRGRGVDAELAGMVEIGGTLDQPVPGGGFDLRRGRLTLLDRQLDVRRGQVGFSAGTLTPYLDLQAEARVREITARVTLQGPATDPSLGFSSTPDLPQDEILARLLFDRPARQLSPFQIVSLAQAAAGLAGYQGPPGGTVLERLRRGLALDRLSVGSAAPGEGRGDASGAAIEGGRYVAPGVYLGVRQGAMGGPPRVGVQVDILPRVRVEAETGGNSQAGDRLGLSFEHEY